MSRILPAGRILAAVLVLGAVALTVPPAQAEFFPNQHGRGDAHRAPERRPPPRRPDYDRNHRRYESRPYDRFHGGYGYGPPPVIYAPPAPPALQFLFPLTGY
jgi:hypothetical protein